MKKRMNILYLAAILAVVSAGFGAVSVGAFGGLLPSANGQGFVGDPDGLRTFSFSAVTRQDGSVNGQAVLHNRRSDFFAKVAVNCLEVVDDTATVSGVITNSSNPEFIGYVALFRVTDNGEGGSNTTDQISGLYFDTPESGLDCRINEEIPQVFIEGGNIQVKP